MAEKPRQFIERFQAGDSLKGFAHVAPLYWCYAERLRNEAGVSTQQFDAGNIPAICLYHATLDCYLNEELSISMALEKADTQLAQKCRSIEDQTLNKSKLDSFASAYGFDAEFSPDVLDYAVMFAKFRNMLHHHSPEMRPLNEYPIEAANVFKIVGVEPINTQDQLGSRREGCLLV